MNKYMMISILIAIPIFIFLMLIESWSGHKNEWLRNKFGVE